MNQVNSFLHEMFIRSLLMGSAVFCNQDKSVNKQVSCLFSETLYSGLVR